jgi:folate-dependent phosphoribosylglycinamide formyltransferase PurN
MHQIKTVSKIKIGLLIDDYQVSKWINELVHFICMNTNYQLVLVIVNRNSNDKKKYKYALYRLLRKADRAILGLPDSPFTKEKLVTVKCPYLEVNPLQGVYTDTFSDEDIAFIQRHTPDILLRFGFRILKGKILSVAKYGILSLHHGDTDQFRGGPPAFWEVVKKAPVSAVTLQQLTDKLDGGNILEKAFVRTDQYSFARNQHKLYLAGLYMFKRVLEEIALQSCEVFFSRKQKIEKFWYSSTLYKDPINLISINIAIAYTFNNLKRVARSFFFRDQWQILFALEKSEPGNRPFYQYNKLKPPADRIWADPFVIRKDNVFYLFFEEKYFNKKYGQICCLRINTKGDVLDKIPEVVLKENWHLSYPYVFEHEGKYYMIPESGDKGEVNLYKADSFPFQWKKVKTLLQGFHAFDSTLHYQDDQWWLFCTVRQTSQLSADACLYIFYCNNFLSDQFVSHPSNPVYDDVRKSRPAGRIFCHNGQLIRPSQIGAPVYGYGIQMNRIVKLNRSTFAEVPEKVIKPNWLKNQGAVHTWNHYQGLSVLDVQVRRLRWI